MLEWSIFNLEQMQK